MQVLGGLTFVAVAGGQNHSLGLKTDGSIVAWGRNDFGQCNAPLPNADFVAVAGGGNHSLGVKGGGGCDPCDANCDGAIDAFDIEAFINILLGGTGCSACAGDTNGDGAVDAFDIEPFIACLVGPQPAGACSRCRPLVLTRHSAKLSAVSGRRQDPSIVRSAHTN
jgi:hypothetical protein